MVHLEDFNQMVKLYYISTRKDVRYLAPILEKSLTMEALRKRQDSSRKIFQIQLLDLCRMVLL